MAPSYRALACAVTDSCAGLILGFEIEFDLDVSKKCGFSLNPTRLLRRLRRVDTMKLPE
jgi:hypothetical protein